MKTTVKNTLLFIALDLMALYSKSISKAIVYNYNNCITFIGNNTVGSSPILGI